LRTNATAPVLAPRKRSASVATSAASGCAPVDKPMLSFPWLSLASQPNKLLPQRGASALRVEHV